MAEKRKLRMGMVGGGEGAFIGAVHRMAAALDGKIELVAGCFSSDAERSLRSGKALFLPAERVYADYQQMMLSEAALATGERIDFVSIVTPNHAHYGPAEAALQAGFAVVCDKPLTLTVTEAETLVKLANQKDQPFCVTHNYSGYPMVKQARHLVASGKLGKVRKVLVEYNQGWLSTLLEASGQKQASWRTDPARSGAAGAMGDIGSHAGHLAEYILGEHIESVEARLDTVVEGRQLDDDASVRLYWHSGIHGTLTASQISQGEENGLCIRIYGENAGLTWRQQEPNTLSLHSQDAVQIFRTGVGDLSEEAKAATRLPGGHPEGYLEAFANLYLGFAYALAQKLDVDLGLAQQDFVSVEDGLQGMRLIEACVQSSRAGGSRVHLLR